jgi:hypothetical protein
LPATKRKREERQPRITRIEQNKRNENYPQMTQINADEYELENDKKSLVCDARARVLAMN